MVNGEYMGDCWIIGDEIRLYLLSCEVTIISPSLFILDGLYIIILSRTAWGSQSAEATWNRISTLVFNLLTFWPPGPLDLEYRKSILSSGISISRGRGVDKQRRANLLQPLLPKEIILFILLLQGCNECRIRNESIVVVSSKHKSEWKLDMNEL